MSAGGPGYTFFHNVLDVANENLPLVTAGFVSAVVVAKAIPLYPKFKKAAQNVVPREKFTLQNGFEMFADFIDGLCHQVIGHGHRKYVPLVGTVFIFIFACNIIGLVPGFMSPTSTWSTGAAVALIVFCAYNYFGFRENGFWYVKHFGAPVGLGRGILNWILLIVPVTLLHVLMGTVEIISHLFRPFTLTMRLTINLFADHIVLGTFADLVPLIIPIPFLLLGIFVSFMQAFIFTMLTAVYVGSSVAHDH